MRESFSLARMSPLIRGVTVFVLGLPALIGSIGFCAGRRVDGIVLVAPALLIAVYVVVWLYSRPTRFEVGPTDLQIVWPIRRRRIAWREISSLRLIDSRQLKTDFGFTIRVGVGGLWGVFGWLAGPRAGLIDVYVSRLDGWVVIERVSGRPLIISPDRPDEFARAISNEIARAPS